MTKNSAAVTETQHSPVPIAKGSLCVYSGRIDCKESLRRSGA